MKSRFVRIAFFVLFLSFVIVSFKKSPDRPSAQDGSPLLFWTANCHYGPIEVFVNDVYQGDITRCFNSPPECASDGCVTVVIKGDNNVWTAQTKDGRIKWSSKRCRVPDRICNSERLN
jgi:hypothetical protein